MQKNTRTPRRWAQRIAFGAIVGAASVYALMATRTFLDDGELEQVRRTQFESAQFQEWRWDDHQQSEVMAAARRAPSRRPAPSIGVVGP